MEICCKNITTLLSKLNLEHLSELHYEGGNYYKFIILLFYLGVSIYSGYSMSETLGCTCTFRCTSYCSRSLLSHPKSSEKVDGIHTTCIYHVSKFRSRFDSQLKFFFLTNQTVNSINMILFTSYLNLVLLFISWFILLFFSEFLTNLPHGASAPNMPPSISGPSIFPFQLKAWGYNICSNNLWTQVAFLNFLNACPLQYVLWDLLLVELFDMV